MNPDTSEVTALLQRLSAGDDQSLDRLMPLVYDELRRVAAGQLRHERPDHTLTPTSLVHEAFLRMTGGAPVGWEGRSHFFRVAAKAMRRILVDHARRRTSQKRSRQHQVTLEPELVGASQDTAADILGVDEALARLALLDERQSQVVELRYFVGLSIEETAEVIGVSIATIKRDWTVARAWLHRELTPG